MIRNSIEVLLPEKVNRGTLTEIPQICIDAFCESKSSSADSSAQSSNSNCNPTDTEHNKNRNKSSVCWKKNRAFFLTHYDQAVLHDVLDMGFLNMLSKEPDDTVRLYMHELTYEFLLYWARKEDDSFEQEFGLLLQLRQKDKLVFLEIGSPIRLIFPILGNELKPERELVISVTPISAGHNVGSIMLLFERIPPDYSSQSNISIGVGNDSPYVSPCGSGEHPFQLLQHGDDEQETEELEQELRILYTGNCRVLLKDLQKCSGFYHKCGAKKVITHLYVDTTFCMPHVEELPSRKNIETQLIELIRHKLADPQLDEPLHVEIWTPNVLACGLNFIQTLSKEFDEAVHIPKRLAIFFEQIPNFKNYWKSATNQQRLTFHYCCESMEAIEACSIVNDINTMHISLQCNMFRTPIKPTEDEQQLDKSKSVYFQAPDIYRGIYSTNLSKFELARMINFLNVELNAVNPLHRPRFMKFEDIHKEISKACQDTREFQPNDFDDEYSSKIYDFTEEITTLYNRKITTPNTARKGKSITKFNPYIPLGRQKSTFYHYPKEADVYSLMMNRDDSPYYEKPTYYTNHNNNYALVNSNNFNGEGDSAAVSSSSPPFLYHQPIIRPIINFDNLPATPRGRHEINLNINLNFR